MKRHRWELDVKAEVLEKGYGSYGGDSAFCLSFLVPGRRVATGRRDQDQTQTRKFLGI